ncbi:TatD family hydrolase [Endozoicomonadaceae bacterium StTr2]
MKSPFDLCDTHCHLDFDAFDNDRQQVLENCQLAGVNSIVIPAVSRSSWDDLNQLLQRHASQSSTITPALYGALGIHPWFVADHSEADIEELDQLLTRRKPYIVAVGEAGLDFWHDMPCSSQQQILFEAQVELAIKHKLPLILHARKSYDQILKLLRTKMPGVGGIIHAFSGSEQQARQYIELGFRLGFGGGITYSRAKKTRQLAASLPLDSIVLETDAPDMPLSGFQGQRNTPERLPLVLEALAELRAETVEEIATTTSNNAKQVFQLGTRS